MNPCNYRITRHASKKGAADRIVEVVRDLERRYPGRSIEIAIRLSRRIHDRIQVRPDDAPHNAAYNCLNLGDARTADSEAIYLLRQRSGATFAIGHTANPWQQLVRLCTSRPGGKAGPIHRRCHELARRGTPPALEILEWTTPAQAHGRVLWWSRLALDAGTTLLNIVGGAVSREPIVVRVD